MSTALDDLRAAWTALYRTTLPALAAARSPVQPRWPVHLDHCFARVILDSAVGGDRPWHAVLTAPAVRNMSAEQLRAAIGLGERIADGKEDLVLLDERSLRLRGKRKGGGAGGTERSSKGKKRGLGGEDESPSVQPPKRPRKAKERGTLESCWAAQS